MKQRSTVKIALVQMQMSADRSANLATAIEQIRIAGARGAQIVCLPELFSSLYFCQTEDAGLFDLAEPIPGPTTHALSAAAAAAKVVLVGPVFERRAPGLYHNSAVVFDERGQALGTYRKMHIPDDPNYYEKFYFTPGDLGFRRFVTSAGKIGVLICWDQWFPEGARLTALAGADILFYPTAIGWLPQDKPAFGVAQHSAWETVQRGHAVANGVFVAAVNRVGVEGEIEFWGQSFVADPMGTIIAKAGLGEELLLVDCDWSQVERVRRGWPFLRDRRIDAYQGILHRHLESTDA